MKVYRNRLSSTKRRVLYAFLTIFIIAALSLAVALLWQNYEKNAQPPPSSSQPEVTSGEPEAPDIAEEAPQPPDLAEPSEADNVYPVREGFENAVPESTPVSDSYFEDAIFFGDSISTGIIPYKVLPKADVVAYTGISVTNILTRECMETEDGELKTMLDYADIFGEKNKVYILLGGNSVDYEKDVFKKSYGQFIDAVKAKYPGAVIYIQTMTPVTDYASDTYDFINPEIITEYNLIIRDLAQEKNVSLVDSFAALADENGKLPDEASPVDGMHFTGVYYFKWFDYLKTHTIGG